MDTLCPKCQHAQKISSRQLKKKSDKIICAQCKHHYRAHLVIDQQEEPEQEPVIIEPYAWQKTAIPHTKRWITGSLIAIFLFIYQVIYFTGYPLTQNTQLRPWLETLSTRFNYPLPAYRNLAEFTTIASSLELINANNYRLQISFINHADFNQQLPDIQLTLHNYHGGIFAQRTFPSREYLGKKNTAKLIKSSATIDIDFFIAVPEQEVGGYSIELR